VSSSCGAQVGSADDTRRLESEIQIYLHEARTERQRTRFDHRDHSLVHFPHSAKHYAFDVWQDGERWSYAIEGQLRGARLTKGDAIRKACQLARNEEAHGHACTVTVFPGDTPLNHYEPYLGD
jgi:hypothetical protein